MLINVFMDETSDPKFFKAPKGFMFQIWDIHFSTLVAGDNSVIVLPYILAHGITSISSIGNKEILAIMNSNILGQAEDFSFTKGEQTKFITVVRDGGITMGLQCVIHYDLIPATKTQLIIEWFRRGR